MPDQIKAAIDEFTNDNRKCIPVTVFAAHPDVEIQGEDWRGTGGFRENPLIHRLFLAATADAKIKFLQVTWAELGISCSQQNGDQKEQNWFAMSQHFGCLCVEAM